jgi:hypothetical protein
MAAMTECKAPAGRILTNDDDPAALTAGRLDAIEAATGQVPRPAGRGRRLSEN